MNGPHFQLSGRSGRTVKQAASFWATIQLACLLVASPVLATPVNSDFLSGLDAWTTSGEVTADDGGARLSDAGGFYSALYQADPLVAGANRLSFDFRAELSSSVPAGPFGFADTFFATLYLTDDLAAFDLSPGSFGDAIALFDYDHTGAFNVAGVIGESATRSGWLSFELTFDSSFAYAIPTFELFGQNFVDGDSSVWIDNVSLEPVGPVTSPIPEPDSLILFLAGIVVLVGALRRGPFGTSKESDPSLATITSGRVAEAVG